MAGKKMKAGHPMHLPAAFLQQAQALLGPQGWSDDPDRLAPYLEDWRGRLHGRSPFAAWPESTAQTAALLVLCREHGIAVTPQGGNTGLVGGSTPNGELLLSMTRMNAITVDAHNDTATAQAGAILTSLQAAAQAAARFFPLSLGSEGSATIGGLIATNAGGVSVLRYGQMRSLVLGLEVVLPDGRIWNGLRSIRKDNTGIDLKQMFIGSEGILGVITAAALRLYPRPVGHEAAWVTLDSPQQAVGLLARVQAAFGGALTSFEVIPSAALALVCAHIPGLRDPLVSTAPWRILIELSLFSEQADARTRLESVLMDAASNDDACEAVVALSDTQRRAFWRVREAVPEAEKRHGEAVKHDICVPVSALPDFMAKAEQAIMAHSPGAAIIAFGHFGDGNLHYNIGAPIGSDPVRFLHESGPGIMRIVHDLVTEMGGSICAEHGVGLFKLAEYARCADPVEIALMRRLKDAIDPEGRLNPGRIIAEV